MAGWWFSPGILVSSTNKTYCHDIAELLLKVALNIINQSKLYYWKLWYGLWCLMPLSTIFQWKFYKSVYLFQV